MKMRKEVIESSKNSDYLPSIIGSIEKKHRGLDIRNQVLREETLQMKYRVREFLN